MENEMGKWKSVDGAPHPACPEKQAGGRSQRSFIARGAAPRHVGLLKMTPLEDHPDGDKLWKIHLDAAAEEQQLQLVE